MNIHNFIWQNNIRPADAIVVKKTGGLLDHYVIYLGVDEYNRHLFIVNMAGSGITVIHENRAMQFLLKYIPNRVNRFQGTDLEREEAVDRALTYPNQGYHLISNNCEHYANFVQRGVRESKQSNFGVGLGLVALIALIFGSMERD